MKYSFPYKFKTVTNTELYQIIFVTPNIRGLEKLKIALWKTFNGKFYHRNSNTSSQQLSFLTDQDDRQFLLGIHAQEARDMIRSKFQNQTVNYAQIEEYLIENSMLQIADIQKNVLKPLIIDGSIIKAGLTKNKNNYKDDNYTIL